MAADDRDGQLLPVQQGELLLAVALFAEGTLDLEVIAPAAQVQPLIAPFGDVAGQLLQGEVGPAATEQEDRSCHDVLSTTLGNILRLAASLGRALAERSPQARG